MTTTLTYLIAAVLMHPVHETVSEIEWNPESKRMEIAIRMSVLDEQWIQRRLDSAQAVDQWAVNYLESTYRFDPVTKTDSDPDAKQTTKKAAETSTKKPKPTHKVHWVGRDEEGSHVWWYVEIEPLDGKKPRVLEQRMFFERNQSYTNRVVLLGQVPRKAMTHTIQKPKVNLDWKADDKARQRTDAAAK